MITILIIILIVYIVKKKKEEYESQYDWRGFNEQGIHKNGTLYNNEGYDKYYFDREGYNRVGYDRNGYDRNGYDKDGFNKNGYDKDGYNKHGYNKDGYDKDGFNIDGFNKEGYNKDGYDKNGFNAEGYNKYGVGQDGRTKLEREKIKTYGMTSYEMLIYPIKPQEEVEPSSPVYRYVSVAFNDYELFDFELGEEINFPITTNRQYSYCSYVEELEYITPHYHTHLDCHLFWEEKLKENFWQSNTWYLADVNKIYSGEITKCKICEERDKNRDITNW